LIGYSTDLSKYSVEKLEQAVFEGHYLFLIYLRFYCINLFNLIFYYFN